MYYSSNIWQMYVHCTTATDTTNVEVVWGTVKQIILDNGMKLAGLGRADAEE